jgi:hypothetical protein
MFVSIPFLTPTGKFIAEVLIVGGIVQLATGSVTRKLS